MIESNQFKAGRIYSVIYGCDVDMVGKRQLDDSTLASLIAAGVKVDTLPNGKHVNPLASETVTVRRVSSVQAAGGETWERFKARNGIETKASNRPAWYRESLDNNCIVEGVTANTQGKRYLRGLPQGVTKEQYFIGGREATEAEAITIRAFKQGSGGGDFVVLALDNLQNVQDVTQ